MPVSALTVSKGVVSGGGRSVTYGQLLGGKLFNVRMPDSYGLTPAAVAARQAAGLLNGVPGTKPAANYELVGTSVPRL